MHQDFSNIGETSIQLTPSDYSDETPSGDTIPQGTIFSSIPNKGENSPVIDKLASVHPPEKNEVAHAVVAKENIKTPEAFITVEEDGCRTWIANMEELIDAVREAKGKQSDIDPDMAQNDRERALLVELKEKDEAIDRPAWIVNNGEGALIINDLDITLPMNSPYDLSNISARRIIMSRDLKGLIKEGHVKFISPAEKDEIIIENVDEESASMGLDVFDSPEQAEANMTNSVSRNPVIDDSNAMEVVEGDIENLTEEESMVLDLTQGMPTVKEQRQRQRQTSTETTIHTKHGSSEKAKSSNIKPIRKLS
jgi:hypothetical protein